MGRTGKKNPRLARTFLQWVDEDVVIKVIKNMYGYIEKHIDRSLPKEHVGYIVDRTGYNIFKEEVLAGVNLPETAQLAEFMDFGGYFYLVKHRLTPASHKERSTPAEAWVFLWGRECPQLMELSGDKLEISAIKV